MPRVEFFARFGFLAVRGFLDSETCRRVRAEIRAAAGAAAPVRGRGGVDEVVNVRLRRVTWTEVADSTRLLVEERLGALRPELERHFRVVLSHHEGPSFLRYGAGDLYVPHRDWTDDPGAAPMARRRVSVVAFLNGEGEGPASETYRGGALTFLGLLDDPRLRGIGVPVMAEPGLLLAFPSDVLHAVTPVTHGERYTIVSWFS